MLKVEGGKGMGSTTLELIGKARRRLWMKYALRGVGANDNHHRLDLAYTLPDPWHMSSAREKARFAATNAVIQRAFGHVGSLLELGCGEGHQTLRLREACNRIHAVDVSAQAIDRARKRVSDAQFAATDIFGQPWGGDRNRFDLVTACEMLYYVADPAATLRQMRYLAPRGLVTFFAPACGRVGPHLDGIPGLHREWFFHERTAWLVGWWRDE
jgi:SAM-dependent methyltransferase